jgi:hypothetical protein
VKAAVRRRDEMGRIIVGCAFRRRHELGLAEPAVAIATTIENGAVVHVHEVNDAGAVHVDARSDAGAEIVERAEIAPTRRAQRGCDCDRHEDQQSEEDGTGGHGELGGPEQFG